MSLALAGCAVEEEFVSAASSNLSAQSAALISDQYHNQGTVGFLFLPPMVPRPATFGDVVPELPIRVEVNALQGQGLAAGA